MRIFCLVLKLASLVFFAVAGLHLVFGLGADQMLGAQVSAQALTEPSLDSQNRFYGVAFAFYGVVLYLGATNLSRFEPMLVAAFAVFFLAGCARLVAWSLRGAPAPLVVMLMVSELALPPLLTLWLRKVMAESAAPRGPTGHARS